MWVLVSVLVECSKGLLDLHVEEFLSVSEIVEEGECKITILA